MSDNNRNSIEDTSLVRIFGIDYKDGTYTVSILYNNSANSEDEKSFKSLSGEGESVFAAYDAIRKKSEYFPSLSQIKYFIIGKEAAQNGIKEALDFAVRHEQIKTDVEILIASDGTAKTLIENNKQEGSFLGDTLQTSQHKEMKTVRHIDSTLLAMQKHLALRSDSFLIVNLNSSQPIFIDGYAVFEDNKLVDTIDANTALGIDFLLGNVRSVPVFADGFSSIIIDIKAKKKAVIKNGKLSYSIKTDFSTAIREVNTDELNTDLDFLEQKQNEYVNALINKAVLYLKNTNLDLIDLKSLFNSYCPKEWRKYKESFEIKNVDFIIDTSSTIAKTFDFQLTEEV